MSAGRGTGKAGKEAWGGGNPTWLALALGLFAFVQACFGIAVGAGWRPWESPSAPVGANSATGGEQGATGSETAPWLGHLVLTIPGQAAVSERSCYNAARAAFNENGLAAVEQIDSVQALYGSRGRFATLIYCNKLESRRIDIVFGFPRPAAAEAQRLALELSSDLYRNIGN